MKYKISIHCNFLNYLIVIYCNLFNILSFYYFKGKRNVEVEKLMNFPVL